MASSKVIRLSPSGPFIKDGSVNGGDLLAGDGTPGLVWRSQGPDPAAVPVAFHDDAMTEIPELTITPALADVIPGRYHYDVELHLWVDTSVALRCWGALNLAIEIEEDTHPGVWAPVQNQTGNVVFNYDIGSDAVFAESVNIQFGNVDLDRTGSALAITGVRVTAQAVVGGGTPVPFYIPQLSTLRITQYVSD